MARPLIPIGISAAILGGLVLFAPRVARAAGTQPNTNPIPNGGGRRTQFPPGTPIAIVNLTPDDCEALRKQGLACGVRVRSQPNRTSSIVDAGVPQGQPLAVLSAETTDSEGRKWRQVETLAGLKGYAPFVGPNGIPNVSKPGNSGEWPGGGGDAMAGYPRGYGNRGAYVGCPQDDDMLGWAPWGSAYARVGQGVPSALVPGGRAVCTRECLLYVPFERGVGWTVRQKLPAGTAVRLVPPLPFGVAPRGPGADYLLVTTPAGIGWIHRAQLQGVRPRAFGRFRPGLPGPAVPLPASPPVLR